MPTRSDAELLAASDHQSAAFFRAAARYPWATVHDDGDVVYGTTGIPLEVFNGATCARFEPATAAERIEAVLAPFRAARIDMSWMVGPTSTPADLVERLQDHGLVVDATEPVLGTSLEDWSAVPLADGIELEWVTHRAGFDEASRVMFAGFGMPESIFDAFADRFSMTVLGPDSYQRVVLARIDGEPVSTALGAVLDGVLGVYNVATIPARQRRGGGTAVTRAVIEDGIRQGAVAAMLQTSDAGRPVYERIGFHEVGTVTVLAGRFAGEGTGGTGSSPD
ncbi:MAG TPA: GNAT family N-acetyltransferase [Candidatus Limnocylindrales bacterium]|nr:GNAT family N-acetyltransferase [Candidatus Limnocylindrales bacterium]